MGCNLGQWNLATASTATSLSYRDTTCVTANGAGGLLPSRRAFFLAVGQRGGPAHIVMMHCTQLGEMVVIDMLMNRDCSQRMAGQAGAWHPIPGSHYMCIPC
jgi:hypothetical protein